MFAVRERIGYVTGGREQRRCRASIKNKCNQVFIHGCCFFLFPLPRSPQYHPWHSAGCLKQTSPVSPSLRRSALLPLLSLTKKRPAPRHATGHSQTQAKGTPEDSTTVEMMVTEHDGILTAHQSWANDPQKSGENPIYRTIPVIFHSLWYICFCR